MTIAARVNPSVRRTATQAVAADLRSRLLAGEWPAGTRIPKIDDLQCVYSSSRMTVARGVRRLVEEGLLESRGKAGTWVCHARPDPHIGILANYDFRSSARATFAGRLLELVRDRLMSEGVHVSVYQEPSQTDWLIDGNPSAQLMADSAAGGLSGLITVASNYPEWVRRDAGRRIAVPTVDISWHPSPYHVYVDYREAVRAAVSVIRVAGLDSMGMIGCPSPCVYASLTREAAAAGVLLLDRWVDAEPVLATEQRGFEQLIARWRGGEERPAALFVPDDTVAKGVCQGLLHLGIAAEERPLVVVMVNSGTDMFFPCPVSRLVLDLSEMAAAAIALLRAVQAAPDRPAEDRLVAPRPQSNLTSNSPLLEDVHVGTSLMGV